MSLKIYLKFLVFFFLIIYSSISVTAQTPIVSRAVKFAESLPAKDLPALKDGSFRTKKAKDNGEINEENGETIREIDKNAKPSPDAALFSKSVINGPVNANPPNPPSVGFDGIIFSETSALGQGFLPSDVNGEVGPNHFVQTVNVAFRIFNKSGTPLTPLAALSSLFSPLGTVGNRNDGDPIVLYDQLADRWIISQFVTLANPNNHQVIAVSKTSDPTGAYYLYDFAMPNNKFNDYPKFGMWPDGYYMTDNQFNQAGDAFLGGGYFAFDRLKMLAGDPTASYIYFDSCPTNAGCDIGGVLPADMDGLIPPAVGTPCPFAYFIANEYGDPSDGLRIFDFHADFAVPANSTFSERVGSPLAVAAFDPRSRSGRADVNQPAPATTTHRLDAMEDRLMFRLSYRNFGTSESLVANHTVNATSPTLYKAGVRVYQLTRATPAAPFTIAEQQTFDGGIADLTNRWMGSAATNFQNDLAVGYSVSSTTVFPGIRYAAKLGTDAPGSGLAQGEQTIIDGAGSQTTTSGRWGDYSDLTVDPSDDCSFWYTQNYISTSGTGVWKTRIAKFAPGTVAVSPRGTISGAVTICASGNPINNATITITGGYFRSSDIAGGYNATVVPGIYTVTVTAPGGYTPVTVNNVVVANGGNVTVNVCMVGIAILTAPVATIVTESCIPANGVLDPGETVTVSLCVQNTGGANTTNLVGTLQATGGITSPSGPQAYGVVIAGGASVCRDFTFTVNGTCGGIVTATLQLQDGVTNLGTVTYTFAVGTTNIISVLSENFDAVVAPALPAGWSTAATGIEIPWVTSTTNSNSAPNNAFAPNVGNVGNTELTTPSISVPASGGQLTFKNLYNMEPTFDGMVLEISINGGAFGDITAGGNSFLAGGYNGTIGAGFGSPIGGRQAWTGLSGGTAAAPTYITSTINLPVAAAGQNIHLRWRAACDNSVFAPGAAGVKIDNISISNTNFTCCANLPAPTVTINQAVGQLDPTTVSPINFTVVFSEAMTGFATGDVTLSGTAGATTAIVTGGPTTYNVAVSGMTGNGTVIATITANAATGTINVAGNAASTSTDNTVTFNMVVLPNPCSSITTIACATPATAIFVGAGIWSPGNCGFSTPGNEKIYSFTPTVTGVHSLQVTAASGG
ncbi:MAG: hypothetical protein ABIP79_14425, partial [Chitinophagaceae bacterium]